MGSIVQLIKRLFALFLATDLVRLGTLPTSADAVAAAAVQLTSAAAAWTFGAWAQIAATVGTAEVWITGYSLENFIGAPSEGEIEIGIGAALAEVAIARIQIARVADTLPVPLHVPAGTRVAARYRTATGVADNVSIKLNTLAGV